MTSSQREVFNRREVWGLWGFRDLKGLWKKKDVMDVQSKGRVVFFDSFMQPALSLTERMKRVRFYP